MKLKSQLDGWVPALLTRIFTGLILGNLLVFAVTWAITVIINAEVTKTFFSPLYIYTYIGYGLYFALDLMGLSLLALFIARIIKDRINAKSVIIAQKIALYAFILSIPMKAVESLPWDSMMLLVILVQAGVFSTVLLFGYILQRKIFGSWLENRWKVLLEKPNDSTTGMR